MITILSSLIMAGSVLVMVFSKNPMKTSFFILISAMIIIFNMKLKTGNTWIPLIFFILFTGGILLMFMILASILPNEKTMKIKIPKLSILPIILITLLSAKLNPKEGMEQVMKSFLSSSMNMIFMATIILLYFFCSMSINKVEEYSMRSVQCWKEGNFVSYQSKSQQ